MADIHNLFDDLGKALYNGVLDYQIEDTPSGSLRCTITIPQIHIDKFTELYAYLIAKYPSISFQPWHQHLNGKADETKVWDAIIRFKVPE